MTSYPHPLEQPVMPVFSSCSRSVLALRPPLAPAATRKAPQGRRNRLCSCTVSGFLRDYAVRNSTLTRPPQSPLLTRDA